jgi:methionine-S-sulfoxide reductase
VHTRVGYAGGIKDSPTYYTLGDHTEVVQICFNPDQVSYKDLLKLFFSSHNPALRPYSRQYMSLILYHDERQQETAQGFLEERSAKGQVTHTEMKPLSRFFMAEAYHQKYYLRRVRVLADELTGRFSSLEEFVSSPIVTRINGYVGGYGTIGRLQEEIQSFHLSEKSEARLLDLASH